MPDDFHALLRRERAVATITRELQDLLASMKERGAERETIDIALKHLLATRGVTE